MHRPFRIRGWTSTLVPAALSSLSIRSSSSCLSSRNPVWDSASSPPSSGNSGSSSSSSSSSKLGCPAFTFQSLFAVGPVGLRSSASSIFECKRVQLWQPFKAVHRISLRRASHGWSARDRYQVSRGRHQPSSLQALPDECRDGSTAAAVGSSSLSWSRLKGNSVPVNNLICRNPTPTSSRPFSFRPNVTTGDRRGMVCSSAARGGSSGILSDSSSEKNNNSNNNSDDVDDDDYKDKILAPWPADLSHNTSLSLRASVKCAAQWLKMHDVVDPEPSAAELLAKAAGFRSPQAMYSTWPIAPPPHPPATHSATPGRGAAAAVEQMATMEQRHWDEMRRLCVLRAAQHMPVQYLVGEWDFHRLSLEMKPPTLIPRPETEELVEMVLEWLRREITPVALDETASVVGDTGETHDSSTPKVDGSGGGLRFLDVGSGTGAIGLALLNELPRGARCVAVDAQEAAVKLSRRNAERTGLQDRYSCFHAKIGEFGMAIAAPPSPSPPLPPPSPPSGIATGAAKHGEVKLEGTSRVSILAPEDDGGNSRQGRGGGGASFDGCFDFIVSNPPYIPRRDMEALPLDVAEHEDSVALDGGLDGLDVVREIVRRCPRLLRRDGPRELWMEVDTSHPEAMQRWLGLAVGGGEDRVQACEAYGVERFEWMNDMFQRPRFVRLTFAAAEER